MLRLTAVMLRFSGLLSAGVVSAALLAGSAVAQDVRITEDMPDVTIALNGQQITIARNQDQTAVVTGDFAKTSRACPPFCIQPSVAAPGVETVAELEVISFLQADVAAGTGLLMDSRLPEWFVKGTLPGAVNVPFSTLAADNPFRNDILVALGAVANADGTLDFTAAFDLTLFCNGPWCAEAPRAVNHLIEAGYPVEKLHYYRGGMQDWILLGLTVVEPNVQG